MTVTEYCNEMARLTTSLIRANDNVLAASADWSTEEALAAAEARNGLLAASNQASEAFQVALYRAFNRQVCDICQAETTTSNRVGSAFLCDLHMAEFDNWLKTKRKVSA